MTPQLAEASSVNDSVFASLANKDFKFPMIKQFNPLEKRIDPALMLLKDLNPEDKPFTLPHGFEIA